MSDAPQEIDGETMKFGLLMESAQAHQKLAENHLERLRAHTLGLDGVVRDEIRRTLVAEMQSLAAETRSVMRSLQAMKRAASLRGVWWIAGTACLCTAIPTAVARFILPSAPEIAALREQRDTLRRTINDLAQHGGRAQWRRCGDAQRFCVRIDRKAPPFGADADYYVLRGY